MRICYVFLRIRQVHGDKFFYFMIKFFQIDACFHQKIDIFAHNKSKIKRFTMSLRATPSMRNRWQAELASENGTSDDYLNL